MPNQHPNNLSLARLPHVVKLPPSMQPAAAPPKIYFPLCFPYQGRNWTEFVGLSRGVQVGDLALLPLTAFSPGVGHMGAGGLGHPEARVQHLFRGSWQRQGVGGGGRRSWRRLR